MVSKIAKRRILWSLVVGGIALGLPFLALQQGWSEAITNIVSIPLIILSLIPLLISRYFNICPTTDFVAIGCAFLVAFVGSAIMIGILSFFFVKKS